MSMQTSIIRGYGVDSTVLDCVTTKNLLDFVKKHCSLLYGHMMEKVCLENGNYLEADCEKWLSENGDNEFGDSFRNSYEWDERKYHLIASVMERETGITFEYVNGNDPDFCNNSAILLAASMPWRYSAAERELTEEQLSGLFKDYFADLRLNVAPDDVEVFYYG